MIQLQNATKRFPNGHGVSGLTFEVAEGESFGYLGPNGSGKSTTIRTLMGFLRVDSGTVRINGLDCWKDAERIQEHVGYLPGETEFLEGLNGKQFLALLAGMRKLKNLQRRDELINRFELDVATPIRRMSKGMKQKLAIVAAFMHKPGVLILDEPTSGLDPLMQQRFLELVEEEKGRGATILMSSHIFTEIERVCDRVGIIKDGHLVAVEDVKSLRSMQRQVFTVQFANEAEANKFRQFEPHVLQQRGHELDIELHGNYNEFIVKLAKCDVQGMHAHELSLEQLFMHYYQS